MMVFFFVKGNVYGGESPALYTPIDLDFPKVAAQSSGTRYTLSTGTIPQSRFRFFIPPGTDWISMKLFCPQEARIAVVVRLGQPPVCEYDTGKEYTLLHWPANSGTTLSNIASNDHQTRNCGGSFDVISSPASDYTGKWVYGKVLKYENNGDDYLSASSISLWINVNDTFLTWYNNGQYSMLPELGYTATTGDCSAFEAGVPDASSYTPPTTDTETPTTGGGLPTPGAPTGYIPAAPDDNAGENDYTGGETDNTVDPVFTPSVTLEKGEWVTNSYTLSQLGSRTEVILKPNLTVTDIPTSAMYDYYAGILKNNVFYIAQKDITEQIVFSRYYDGKVPSYKTASLGNSSYAMDIFYAIMDDWNYSPSALASSGLRFYLGFAPQGSNLDLQDFRGTVIYFTP